MTLVFGIVGVVLNYSSGHSSEWSTNGQSNSIIKVTLGNFGTLSSRYKDDKLIAEAYINFGVIIIILIMGTLLRRRQLLIIKDIDEKNITPSDFTVFVIGLPLDKEKKDVAEWFHQVDPNYDLITINYCYDIRDIIKKGREFDKYNKMKNYIEFYRRRKCKELKITFDEAKQRGIDVDPPNVEKVCCFNRKLPNYDQVIEKTQIIIKQIEEMKKDLDTTTKIERYTGKAFITCQTQGQAVQMINTFKMLPIFGIFYFILYDVFRCKKIKVNKKWFDGSRVIVERAADPGDVYWENLSVSTWGRVKKMMVTYSVLILLLAFVFGIYYGLYRLKKYVDEESKNGSTNSSLMQFIVILVSICSSLITIVVNSILVYIIRLMSSYEKHSTYTKYDLSVATKLMLSTFINSAILPIIINNEKSLWFTSSGLAPTIFFNTLSIAFVSPILTFFSVPYLIQKIKMRIEEKKGENCRLTQKQANDLFEGPNINMAASYAKTGLLFLIVSFYTPIIPILPMIGLVGIFFQYWVEKYLLLRRFSVPETMGWEMAKFYCSLVPYGMLLYSISNYVFLYELSNHTNDHGQYSWWFTIAFVVFPVQTLLGMVIENVKRDENIKYTDAKFTFIQDYDRSNPMSANKARAKYLIELNEKQAQNASEEEKKKLKAELDSLKNNDGLSSILNYTANSKGLEIGKLSNVNKKPAPSKNHNGGQTRLANKFMAKIHQKENNKETNKEESKEAPHPNLKEPEIIPKKDKNRKKMRVTPVNGRVESLNDDKSDVHLKEELKDI